MKLQLTRYQSDPERTFGFLQLSDGWGCYTLERPWQGNERNVSCIPSGDYELVLRVSPIVQRTTGGEFREGYEVVDVPKRTFIMIHPGNFADDTEGCILVGGEPDKIGRELGVTNSRATFRELMRRLKDHNRIPLSIRWDLDDFPRHSLKRT